MATKEPSTDKALTEIRDTVRKNHETLNDLKVLLRTSIIIELWRCGLKQQEIAQRLGVSTHTVNPILKGLTRSDQSG